MAAAFQDAAERRGARVEFKIKRSYSTFKWADDTRSSWPRSRQPVSLASRRESTAPAAAPTPTSTPSRHRLRGAQHRHGRSAHAAGAYRHRRYGGCDAAVAGDRGGGLKVGRLKVESARLKVETRNLQPSTWKIGPSTCNLQPYGVPMSRPFPIRSSTVSTGIRVTGPMAAFGSTCWSKAAWTRTWCGCSATVCRGWHLQQSRRPASDRVALGRSRAK